MNFKHLAKACVLLGAVGVGSAHAGLIAIINGASGTSEPGTTSSITTQLDTLLQAAGNTTDVLDGVPADISGYDQIWDIRFSNSLPISAAEEGQYMTFLQNGGGMFVMGENNNFTTRNNSVLSLIAAAGGGSLSFVSPGSTQDVVVPFDGPNIIADGNVTYSAPGGVSSAGTGQFITTDGVNGTGVAFGVGDLSNALAGALTAIFDVNFMETTAEADSQDLLRNLIQFVEAEVDPEPSGVPVPAPLLLVGFGLLALLKRRQA